MSEGFKTSASIINSQSQKLEFDSKVTEKMTIEKMQTTIEQLIADNRKRDQSMENASSIIESVHNENQRLKGLVDKRNEVIAEQKRQIRELEDSKLQLRNEARETKKMKTVEVKLRGELAQLIGEIQGMKREMENMKKDHQMKLDALDKDLEHERLMKSKILNDFSEINRKEKDSTDLLEDYVLQIRDYETENEKLKKEVLSLKDFRNGLIEKHSLEMKSIQENARKAIERLKDSQKNFNENMLSSTLTGKADPKSSISMKYQLAVEIATEAMQSLSNFSIAVSTISSSEAVEVESLRRRLEEVYEKEILMLDSSAFDVEIQKEIRTLEKRLIEYEEVISIQQGMIGRINQEKAQVFEVFKDSMCYFESFGMQEIAEKNQNLDKVSFLIRAKEKDYESITSDAQKRHEEIKIMLRESENNNRQIIDILAEEFGINFSTANVSVPELLQNCFKRLREEDQLKYDSLKSQSQNIMEESIQNQLKLQNLNGQLKDRLENLQEDIRAKNEQIDELRDTMAELVNESQQEQLKFAELGEELIQKSIEAETLQSQYSQLEQQNQMLIHQVNKLATKDISGGSHNNESQQQQENLINLQYDNQKMRNHVMNLEFTIKEYKQEIGMLKEENSEGKQRISYLVRCLEDAKIGHEKSKAQLYSRKQNQGMRQSALNTTNLSHLSKRDQTLPTNISNDYANTSRISLDLRRGDYEDVDLEEFQRELMEEDFD